MALKDKRREVRLAAREDDLLVEAAGIVGVSVTDFLLAPALDRAAEIVNAHRTITLDDDSHTRFLAALDAPHDEARAMLGDQVARSRRLERAG